MYWNSLKYTIYAVTQTCMYDDNCFTHCQYYECHNIYYTYIFQLKMLFYNILKKKQYNSNKNCYLFQPYGFNSSLRFAVSGQNIRRHLDSTRERTHSNDVQQMVEELGHVFP